MAREPGATLARLEAHCGCSLATMSTTNAGTLPDGSTHVRYSIRDCEGSDGSGDSRNPTKIALPRTRLPDQQEYKNKDQLLLGRVCRVINGRAVDHHRAVRKLLKCLRIDKKTIKTKRPLYRQSHGLMSAKWDDTHQQQ